MRVRQLGFQSIIDRGALVVIGSKDLLVRLLMAGGVALLHRKSAGGLLLFLAGNGHGLGGGAEEAVSGACQRISKSGAQKALRRTPGVGVGPAHRRIAISLLAGTLNSVEAFFKAAGQR
jgi:hypothetical protein